MSERDPSTKWQSEEVAANYRGERFASARAAGRDGELVERLLARHAPRRRFARVLDVPSGTGRLAPVARRYSTHYVAVDVSPAMLGEGVRQEAPVKATAREGSRLGADTAAPLAEAERKSTASWIAADGARLPFATDSFDLVVCCRLLHHLDQPRVLAVTRELARVGSDLVLASFWDAGSYQGWRRRAGLRRDPEGRRPASRAVIAGAFERAGADVLGFSGSLRYWSMQTFVAARVRGAAS